MSTVILIVLAIVVAAVIILAVVIATRPAEFRVARSTTIAAAPEVVFAHVNDLHKWDDWSPWAKRDPDMTKTHEGAPQGEGAVYSWSGNKDVGEGRMTITESKPPERIVIRLEFLKPFAATNTTTFTFTPQDGKTLVEWSMHGTNNFMAKAFQLFMNMDNMIGKDFEEGLANMKAVSEAGPGANA